MHAVRQFDLIALIGSGSGAIPTQSPPEIKVWTARAIATVLSETGREFERETSS